MNKILIFAFLSLLVFSSCQKVIDVDLDNVTPELVIEGVITNNGTPDTVKISKTINFSASNQFVGVANALVIVTDVTSGTIDTLKTTDQVGIYLTSKITGAPGHQYYLRVVSEGTEYTAQSTMPQQVMLDSMYEANETILGKTVTYARCEFMDPADQTNQYRVKAYINSRPLDDILVSSDTYYNGLSKKITVAASDGNSKDADNFKIGDTIKIDFMCIDKNIYTYFYSLKQTLDANSSTLANPVSNISGGSLGYFSAQTSEIKRMVIK